MFGILPDQFYLLEVGEINSALEQFELQERIRKEEWRLTNYIIARPHFDSNKIIPTVDQFHPFPWDKNKKDRVEFKSFDDRIALFIKKGKQDWIPDYWFERSENYKHLCRSKSSISK